MTRAPSALVAIGGFGVAIAMLSVASTAAIVFLTPEPPGVSVSVAGAVGALRGQSEGFDRHYDMAAPRGTRASLIEQVIAAELHRQPADVRAVWINAPSVGAARTGIALRSQASVGRPTDFILVEQQKNRFEMIVPAAATGSIRGLLVSQPQPAFVASVREADGRWLTVKPVEPLLGGWRLKVLAALLVSFCLLAPLTWLFARGLTRPFRVLAAALGTETDPIPEESPRELREAAATIAAMREGLVTEALERARMLTAIAHDLRTPLTGLRLRIETVPEPQRARMVGDVERMQAMIGEVLGFARDAAAPRELLQVRPLLAEIVADVGTGNGAVQLVPGGDMRIAVPAPAFRRVIENLVRNAIDYADGGTITLERVGLDVIVSIADNGPGIPAADRDRLLRPFERGDASRNRETGGAGLGLSIVRDFAARHRGDFTLSDAASGGTVAALRIPAA